ncbi:hypothetical protein HYFRA_00004248 [Hymenoscyphus fraxineus]|uniref:Terpene synthase n=1 Tax=Hymenoscyphus fraxineus TaxID=746836 RepID=A0A9N9KNI3_9HELO|nr:hypothetical protein HYFRA_00004248 [Hymenoscyphus fraxineus]
MLRVSLFLITRNHKMGLILSKLFRWPFQPQAVHDSQATRQKLLASLQGATVTIPNLRGLFNNWPQDVNPEVERLDEDVQRKLEELFSQEKRLRKMKAAKAALFGASWWPYADFDTLRVATYLSIWLFAWDDETDSCEFSTLCTDLEKATQFRAETLNYIRNVLEPAKNTQHSLLASNNIISMFGEIGDPVFKASTTAQAYSFLNELEFFVNMTDVEQRCQMSELPSVEEYQKRRMGSSAVGVCLAITEYCYGMEIPEHVMRGEKMRLLWDETNIIISTSNDILSIKKEIAQEQVDTLIPLLTQRHGSPQAAIDAAFEILSASVKSFEAVSKDLYAQYSEDQYLLLKLEKFIRGCRYACTGNLNWSLCSGRYALGDDSANETFQVTL